MAEQADGVEQAASNNESSDNNVLALIASFFIPGLGQFIQGRAKEGGLFFIIFLVLILFNIVTAGLGSIIAIPIGFVNWILNLYDVWTRWLNL